MQAIRKTISGIDFAFTHVDCAMEPAVIVEMDNYEFLMFQVAGEWKILGEVPRWIMELENKLAEAIESETHSVSI